MWLKSLHGNIDASLSCMWPPVDESGNRTEENGDCQWVSCSYWVFVDILFFGVDLQKTPYDDRCALRIFARCDDVMRMLMKELDVTIPPYSDLSLWSNAQWLADFEKQWPFRLVTKYLWLSVPGFLELSVRDRIPPTVVFTHWKRLWMSQTLKTIFSF